MKLATLKIAIDDAIRHAKESGQDPAEIDVWASEPMGNYELLGHVTDTHASDGRPVVKLAFRDTPLKGE
jgi:hypothetical protein